MTDAPAAAAPIQHSDWKARREYAFLSTAILFAILVVAISLDRHVDAVAWLLGSLFFLFLIAPSAEQAVKMLAVASSLRAGVAFTSSAESNARSGQARSEETAIPATTGD